jgi:DNA-binding IclR family transcriptional regulator
MKRARTTKVATRKAQPSRYRVQVLDRAVEVIDLLAKAGLELGPSEIAGELGLPKSTIHRILTVLERHRLVRKNPAHGKYTVGMKLVELGSRPVARSEVRSGAV